MASERVTLSVDRIADVKTKVCTKCGHPKDVAKDFGVSRRSADGRRSQCKLCVRLAAYAYYHEGGGREIVAAINAKPAAVARRRAYDKSRAKLQAARREGTRVTPLGRAMDRLAANRWRLGRVKTERGRLACRKLIAEYERIVARLRDEHELRKEPPSGKPIGRPMLIRHPTVAGAEL